MLPRRLDVKVHAQFQYNYSHDLRFDALRAASRVNDVFIFAVRKLGRNMALAPKLTHVLQRGNCSKSRRDALKQRVLTALNGSLLRFSIIKIEDFRSTSW